MERRGLSDVVGAHIAAVRYEFLPEVTRQATRRALLDATGVMLAATALAGEARPFADHATGQGGTGQARLLGASQRVHPAGAAFANGALAHALDFGDTFDAGPAHPNAALVPALMALADADPGVSVGALISAMAAGSDLACRLSLAPDRPYEEGGWYPPPLFGTIAAAAAAAKLIGLDADGIVQAMGLAMCQAAFPAEIKYDPVTRLRAVREAFAARAAVDAALLVRLGVRGFAAPLEGRGGFFAIYGGGGFDESVMTADLGRRFLGDEVSFKPWPCCRGTHAYIEAALALRPQIARRAIMRVEAEIGPVQLMLIEPLAAKAAPTSAIDAKFSIPFTAAAALVQGEVTLDTFASDNLRDLAVAQVAARVVADLNPGWGRAEAASGGLSVVLEDGTRLQHKVPQAAGHPDRPMSDADLIAKFVMCAARAAVPIDEACARSAAAAFLDGPANAAATALWRPFAHDAATH